MPVELLSETFRMLSYDSRTIVSISQTCSRWRQVILNDPRAWSYVNKRVLRDNFVSLFLQRSKQQPLSITQMLQQPSAKKRKSHRQAERHADNARDQDSAGVPFGLWQDDFPRVWRLHLDVSTQLMNATSSQFQEWIRHTPAPSLRVLFLGAMPKYVREPFLFTCPSFFGGQSPKLQSLTLVGTRLPWTSPTYTTLTKLEVRIQANDDYGSSDIQRDGSIFSFLQNAPLLEVLHLSIERASASSNLAEEALADPPPVIPMPHAKVVHLELQYEELALILSSIRLPANLKKLVLIPLYYPADPTPEEEFLPLNPSCLPCLNHLDTLLLDFEHGSLRGTTIVGPEGDPDARGSILIELALGRENPEPDEWIDLIKRIEDVHGFQSVTTLEVEYADPPGRYNCDFSVVRESHASIPSLTMLVFRNCGPITDRVKHLYIHKLHELRFSDMEVSASGLSAIGEMRGEHIDRLIVENCTLTGVPRKEIADVFLKCITSSAEWATEFIRDRYVTSSGELALLDNSVTEPDRKEKRVAGPV